MPDHPVQDQRGGHELAVCRHFSDVGVSDLGQHRVHHGQESNGDGQRHRSHLHRVEPLVEIRDHSAEAKPDGHGGENPHR